MVPPSTFLSPGFSLAAVLTWGTGDFLGGYAAKRMNAFLVTAFAHASGVALMLAIALAQHVPLPGRVSILWAIAAGLCGGAALAAFYRALASGHMGLTAPVAAVLGAVIPTLFGIITEGFPRALQIAGFLLAAAGIWLISREEDGRPAGLGLAAISGVGFAAFIICIKQTGDSSAAWSAAFSRAASLILVSGIVLLTRQPRKLAPHAATLGLIAGILDTTGTMLFIRATQTGRLDVAVVLSSLYPAVTVLLAWLLLSESFSRWKALGMVAALIAVPMIAVQ
jgi:drug/metabolite transporter (DMT)-like permease